MSNLFSGSTVRSFTAEFAKIAEVLSLSCSAFSAVNTTTYNQERRLRWEKCAGS